MKQSRLMSGLESLINIVVGFGISLAAQMFFLPLLGVEIAFHQNLAFAVIMTVISLVRSYLLRRAFEAMHIRRPLSPFMQAVIAERFRQVDVEGWSAEHDDTHLPGELAQAGAAYAMATNSTVVAKLGETIPVTGRDLWPWAWDWWKTHDPRRNLVKSCALVIAEGERFDRNRKFR